MTAPRTIVSGGTGYVGRFVVERLLNEGHGVTAIGRNKPAKEFYSIPVEFGQDSLDSVESSAQLFAGAQFFVHCAFDHLPGRYRGGEGADPGGFMRRNLDATLARFRAAKEAGVRGAVFLSSRAVYGDQSAGTDLTETTPTKPNSLYGEMKLATEQGLAELADAAFQTVSLRVTGVYGPPPPGRVHKWAGLVADHIAGKPVASRCGTEVHGDDVAWAALIALTAKLQDPHEVFCVSDIVVDNADIVSLVNEATGIERALPERADASRLNVMNCTKLKALGWRPGGWTLFEEDVRELSTGIAQ